MEQTNAFHEQNRNAVAIAIGSGVLHRALLMPIFDSDSIADRKLAANHLAQILTARTWAWDEDDQSFWLDLKATFIPHAASYEVAKETALRVITWLQAVATQPTVEDPFEGLT